MSLPPFPGFANHRLPGVQRLLARLERGEIRTLVEDLGAGRIVAPNYAPVATCLVKFALGARPYTLLVPASERASVRFDPPAGARCRLSR